MKKITSKQKRYVNWIEDTINEYYGQEVKVFKGETRGQAGKFIRENEDHAIDIYEENELQDELDNIHFGENGI